MSEKVILTKKKRRIDGLIGYCFSKITSGIALVTLLVVHSLYAADGDFYLSFPLPNRDSNSAVINSVFDHSMSSSFYPDGVITAYTGEEGKGSYGQSSWSIDLGYGALYGFKNSNGSNFVVNGNYSGGGESNYLFYDGHPGYDYRTTDQSSDGRINVLAATDGIAYLGGNTYNTVYIDHGSGYQTYYLHLYQRNITDGQSVTRGQVIGISGDTGSGGSPHLRFEVKKNGISVDPYGWKGSGSDPYTGYTGVTNVDLWTSPSNTNAVTHTLTPPSKTTVSRGGILGPFTVKESNNSSSYYAFYVQPYIIKPDGTTVNFKQVSTGLAAGKSRTHYHYLSIPSWSELGTFTFGAKLTDTSGNVIDDDSFEFTVVSGSSYASKRSDRRLKRLMRNPETQVVEEEGWNVVIVPERNR